MEKDIIVNKIFRDCPICDTEHEVKLVKSISSLCIKETPIVYDEYFYVCENVEDPEEGAFIPAKMMDENILRAKDNYRKAKGLLTSNEIIKVRESYSLSQEHFALLLGFGKITINRYEKKQIQEESHDIIMREAEEDPIFCLTLLEKHKDSFTKNDFQKIQSKMIEKIDDAELKNQNIIKNIKARYCAYQHPTNKNGFRIFDFEKTKALIAKISTEIKYITKTKLMKCLWYSDYLAYLRYNVSITGLVYKHEEYGALPISSDYLVKLNEFMITTTYIGSYEALVISYVGEEIQYDTIFSKEELEIIDEIIKKLSQLGAKEISDYMHKELAYMSTKPHEIIPFDMQYTLNDF